MFSSTLSTVLAVGLSIVFLIVYSREFHKCLKQKKPILWVYFNRFFIFGCIGFFTLVIFVLEMLA